MSFWLVLFTANGWALLLLIQSVTTKDRERLDWLQRRAVVCAWMAFIGAAGVIAMAAFAIHHAYNVGAVVGGAGLDAAQKAATLKQGVAKMMQGIFVALLLMPLPLGTRNIVNGRLKKAS
jgi:hypothetical protein